MKIAMVHRLIEFVQLFQALIFFKKKINDIYSLHGVNGEVDI